MFCSSFYFLFLFVVVVVVVVVVVIDGVDGDAIDLYTHYQGCTTGTYGNGLTGQASQLAACLVRHCFFCVSSNRSLINLLSCFTLFVENLI